MEKWDVGSVVKVLAWAALLYVLANISLYEYRGWRASSRAAPAVVINDDGTTSDTLADQADEVADQLEAAADQLEAEQSAK